MKSRGNKTSAVVLLIVGLVGVGGTLHGFGAAQVPVKPASAPAALLVALKSKDPTARRDAANQLGAMRARDSVPSLISALLDKDAGVREAAAFALGQLTDRRAIEPLVGALSDKNAEVRASAIFALGMIGDPKVVLALSNALGDRSPVVRSSAIVGLGLMQDEGGFEELVDMLDDASFDVRYDSVWALGQLGDDNAVEHLSVSLVTLDFPGVDDIRREGFRLAVQNSIESLQEPQRRPARAISSAVRPRRSVAPPREETRPRRTLPYGIVDLNRVTASPKPEAVEKSAEQPAENYHSSTGAADAEATMRQQVLAATNRPVAIVRRVAAVPTERAERAGVNGTVGVRVLAGADGRAVRAYVTRRLGYGLDQRAVQAALQYRFDPALLAGLPQTSWVDIEVKFGH